MEKRLTTAEITAKAVEISKCLINTTVGLHTYDLGHTRTIGDFARVAANIHGAEIIAEKKLSAISAALKIDNRLMLSEILPRMEDKGWIELKKEGTRVRRVEEHIPPIQDVMAALGEEWVENDPTGIDKISVYGLAETSKRPITFEALMCEVEVDKESFFVAKDYGVEAGYFGIFKAEETGKETLWSPLYWAGKIDMVLKFLERQSYKEYEKLGRLTREIMKYPGIPEEKIGDNALLKAGIGVGYFPASSVTDRKNVERAYVFVASPEFEVKPKFDIFEKARLIVASIRHGQYHAEVTKIERPLALLRKLRAGELKPHSYAEIQYAPLITHGICVSIPVTKWYGTGYKMSFIKTPENNIAADIAEQMLKGEEPVSGTTREPEVEAILKQGVYNYSSELRRINSAKRIEATKEFETLLQRMRGSGVVE